MTQELWRPCPGYEGCYAVSSLGRVRSMPKRQQGRILKTPLNKDGYPLINLERDGKRTTHALHRMICRAFHGEPIGDANEAAHLDGDRANAREDNLKWCTRAENCSHKNEHGTALAGDRHPASKLTSDQVKEIVALSDAGFDGHRLGREYGVHHTTISDILRGKRWSQVTGRAKRPAPYRLANAIGA